MVTHGQQLPAVAFPQGIPNSVSPAVEVTTTSSAANTPGGMNSEDVSIGPSDTRMLAVGGA